MGGNVDGTPEGNTDQRQRLRSIGEVVMACGVHSKETGPMLYTIAVVLVVLWLLGLVGGYALGGLIHLLLVIAIVVLAIRLFTGRRVV
jgi:hypothetical protein